MSKVVMRLEKVKTLRDISKREMHNTRSRNVESSSTTGEVIITGTVGVAKEIDRITKQMNKELREKGKRAIRKDAVRCIELLVSSDSEFFKNNNYKKYFEDVEEFLHQFWGKESIIHQKTIHLDESTPHVHYLLSPVVDGKFNYSSFVNGREDLSNFQQLFEDFIVDKGYDIERRQLSKDIQRKHKSTREWSKNMQKAKEYVELMDEKKLVDTAINGIMIEKEILSLEKRLQANVELDDKYKEYKNIADALEKKLRFIMMEQGYNEDFIDYQIKEVIREYEEDNKQLDKNIWMHNDFTNEYNV